MVTLEKPILVTKPFFPPREAYEAYVQRIWNEGWLTNNGPLVQELEWALKSYLDLPHLLFLTNGTIALQLAIRALGLKGDILTTPFSYVATTSSIVWEGCIPKMVDVCPETLNIDPQKIEAAITPYTSAILATHVFGNPCDIAAIDDIAKKHRLAVIYDAAHAFGSQYCGKSLINYGDIAACSFHATKLFHTIEGGAVVAQDLDLVKRMARMRNFGHASLTEFDGVGINGKNSEMHAAMGLCNLPYMPEILAARRRQSQIYTDNLRDLPIQFQRIHTDTVYNHAYYPVIFKDESTTVRVLTHLAKQGVHPRRYFYPALSKLPYVRAQSSPIAEDIASRILCLPLYHTLSDSEVNMICETIRQVL